MSRLAAVLLTVSVMLSACRPAGLAIESTEMLLLESYPVQVRLLVRGTQPACHRLRWDVAIDEGGGRIDVLLESMEAAQAPCLPGRAPFAESIPLGAFATADFEVYLNGEAVGALELP